MKATDLKKGMVIDDGRNIVIKSLDVQSPSSRSGSTLYKVRGYDIVSKPITKTASRAMTTSSQWNSWAPVQCLFREGDECNFSGQGSSSTCWAPA
jgi:hypothetical protein